MASILSRLERLERTSPVDGVALLELQDDGSWVLIHAGRQQKRTIHKSEEDARRHLKPGTTLIIIDI